MPATSAYLPTGDSYIDSLLTGTKWAVGALTFSFPTDPSFYDAGYGAAEPSNCFVAFTMIQQAAVRTILQTYPSVTNLTFTEQPETSSQHADLRYAQSSAPSTAWAYYPSWNSEGGDSWYSNNTNQFDSPIKGNYAWASLIHETGHALGLKHPHEVMGLGLMPLDRDSLEYSVMSYRSYVGAGVSGYSNASDSYPQTLMMYDIAALQTLYGANYGSNSGDTVYTWSSLTGQMFINGVGQGAPVGNKIFLTVWDGGGNDTYDFSSYATNISINLRPGQWTIVSTAQLANLGGGHQAAGNIANALLFNNNPASLIENVIGGSGHDNIFGNDANNRLTGNAGNDTLDGGAGADTMFGGAGNDTYVVDNAGDVVDETGGAGADTVQSSITFSLSDVVRAIGFIENLTLTGAGDIDGVGTAGVNAITGNSGNNELSGDDGGDTIAGGAGNDTLDGGADADALAGGNGDDTYVVDNAGDVVDETGSAGADTVNASVTFSLSDVVHAIGEIENLTLTGLSNIDGTGTAFANVITGNSGNNVLSGDDGNDTLTGGDGNDTLAGGAGVDRFIVDSDADTVADLGFGGADVLTVSAGAAANVTLAAAWAATSSSSIAGTANLITAGYSVDLSAATLVEAHGWHVSAAGTYGAITVIGSGGDDTLTGGLDGDIIDGRSGNDLLAGGAGAETFVYSTGGGADVVTDFNSVDGDRIDLTGVAGNVLNLDDVLALASGISDTVISFGAGDSLTLSGVAPESLTAADFVFAVNLPASAVTLTNAVVAIAENTSTTNHIKVADIGFIDDGRGGNTLGLSGMDAAAFEIVGTELFLKAGTALDRESQSSYVVVVIVDDPTVDTTPDASTTYTLSVSNVSGVAIVGTSSADAIHATATVSGQSFPTDEEDIIQGLGGNDTLQGLGGNDVLDGGDGYDRAVYTDATGGITVGLASGAVTGAAVGIDTLHSIEQIRGSNFADTLVAVGFGPTSANAASAVFPGVFYDATFEGMGGDDTIAGAGTTQISYQSATAGLTVAFTSPGAGAVVGDESVGNDTFSGVNSVRASAFADTLLGSDNASGVEDFTGGAGDDSIDGGGGYDRAGYASLFDDDVTGGVTIDLAAGIASGDASVGTDTLRSIEAIRGSNFDDVFDATGFGQAGALNVGSFAAFNEFEGMAGDDDIVGNGNTRIAFYHAAGGVIVNLAAGTATGDVSVGSDSFTGVNAVTGSYFADTIIGDGASNTLTGGLDADMFVYSNGGGADIITDFSHTEGDGIDLTGVSDVFSLDDVLALASGISDTVIDFGASDSLTLSGVAPGSLTEADFVFAVNLPASAVTLANAVVTIAENTSTTSHIKVTDIGFTDDDRGSNTLGLSGTDAAAFEIVGTELFLKAGTALDRESQSSYVVAVTVDDPTVGTTPDASTTYTLTINNILGATINGTSAADVIDATHTVAGQPLPTNEEDIINGNGGNDTLRGLGGNDTLNGGAGADTLVGGLGDDTYVVDTTLDVVTENPGEGTDTVQTALTYTLGANVEKLTLTGASAINGTGNTLGNTITGNGGNNILAGLGGADSLDGGGGIDTVSYVASASAVNVSLMMGVGIGGDAESDSLVGIENLTGSSFNDTLEGDGGNNVLSGGSGPDTVSYEHATAGVTVSLAVTVAQNTVGAGSDTLTSIENLTGAAGYGNTLTGNSSANRLMGGTGNDMLNGATGIDTILGGLGDDTYVVDSSSDVVTENVGEGVDTVQSSVTYTLAAAVENLTLIGTSAISGTGNVLSNVVVGNSANNTLTGLGGADSLDGGAGADTASYAASATAVNVSLITGSGSGGDAEGDTLVNVENLTGSSFNDTLEGDGGSNALNGGLGIDTVSYGYAGAGVMVSLALTTAQNTIGAGSDMLTGIENLIGSNFDDTLTGNSGANVLTGGAGNDTLSGGAGNDTMLGGSGDDTYVVDAAGDVVTENVGEGTDTVQSSVSTTIGANVERLTLTGTAAINGTGNVLNNVITGNSGANVLAGLGDADSLDGGAGTDTATYAASASAVSVSLAIGFNTGGDAQGDTLINIENLTGSSFNDTLEGDGGNNGLNGGLGTDTASYEHATAGVTVSLALTTAQNTVGAGTDTLTSIEILAGSSFADVLTGSSAANVVMGFAGNDMLNGGSGNDTMLGGLGDDIYVVDTASDVVTENAGEGTDTVQSSASYTIGANIERLVLTGTSAVNGTGNGDGNIITGNAGANILAGLGGGDTLDGGAGVDTASYAASYPAVNVSLMTGIGSGGDAEGDALVNIENLTGSNANDTLEGDGAVNVLNGGLGTDTASYEHSGSAVTVSLALTTAQNTVGAGTDTLLNIENLAGSAFGDVLTGNTGANVLSGGSGNDTLNGGSGNDTLEGGSGSNTFVFGIGFGLDKIKDFKLGQDIVQIDHSVLPQSTNLAAAISDCGCGFARLTAGANTITFVGVSPNDLKLHTSDIHIV